MKKKPIISVITATYNAEIFLHFLAESLLAQTCQCFEWIVQDGVSTDRTLEVLEKYVDVIDCSVVSEPDCGIYDAWNKAIARARGSWLLFLGADDSLHAPNSLELVAETLSTVSEGIDFFSTALLLTLSDGTVVEKWVADENAYERLPSMMTLPHPALFYRSSLFRDRRFPTCYRIAGDYAFLCSALTACNYKISNIVTVAMRVGGVSGSLESMLDSELECLRISRIFFPKSVPIILYARIFRSACYRIISRIFGDNLARLFADTVRRFQGKVPLWTLDVFQTFPRLPADPHITLVVATLGRTDALLRLFESLKLQTWRNFDVVIVDQNPSGFLDTVLATVDNNFALTVLHESILNASIARNRGLDSATGDIIAFPDDDCWYSPSTLACVVEFFNSHSAVGGLFVSWGAVPDSDRKAGVSHLTRSGCFWRGETYVQFYRRAALDGVHFDPNLGPGTPFGSGEDTDLALQVLGKRVMLARLSEVLVYHPVQHQNCSSDFGKVRLYAAGRMQVLKKHQFPWWFKLANIVYPLFRAVSEGPKSWRYRMQMFYWRLKYLI